MAASDQVLISFITYRSGEIGHSAIRLPISPTTPIYRLSELVASELGQPLDAVGLWKPRSFLASNGREDLLGRLEAHGGHFDAFCEDLNEDRWVLIPVGEVLSVSDAGTATRTALVAEIFPPAKRPFSPGIPEPELKRICRMNMDALRDLEAPSYAARNALLFNRQVRDNDGAIWNGRPLDLLEAPIRIYHPAFTRILSCTATPLSHHHFSSEELDLASSLVNALARYYRDEDERIEAIRGYMEAAVRRSGVLVERIHRLGKRSNGISIEVRPAGTVFTAGLPKALLLLTEVKNGIGEGNRDPVMLAAYEYVALAVSDELQAAREKSCLPALILVIIGEHVVIHGAVLLDGKPVVQRLTSLVTFGATENIRVRTRPPLAENPDRIECGRSRVDEGTLHAARVLRALRDGVEALERYYSALASAPIPPPGTLRCHPHLTTLTSSEHGPLKLQYTARLSESNASRAVFKARMTLGDASEQREIDVAVKFTHAYHRGAHALLAGLSPPLAPRLWYCAREDVGMCVVVMEFIDCEDKWRARGTQDETYVETLRTAIEALHEREWVFGDLRLSNVLPDEDGIKLIDFEWCGSVGEARYPSDVNLNGGIGWHRGVRRGGLIEKEHDRHMFKVVTGREF